MRCYVVLFRADEEKDLLLTKLKFGGRSLVHGSWGMVPLNQSDSKVRIYICVYVNTYISGTLQRQKLCWSIFINTVSWSTQTHNNSNNNNQSMYPLLIQTTPFFANLPILPYFDASLLFFQLIK